MGTFGSTNDDDGGRKTQKERDSTMASTITNSNIGEVASRNKGASRRAVELQGTPPQNEKQKKGAFSRLSGRWKGKKSGGSSLVSGHSGKTCFVLMPDLMENDPNQEVPIKAKGNVTLKKCKKLTRKKDYKVKLQEGLLKLYPKGNTAAALEPEFKIDLSQVTVSYDDNIHRLKLVFKIEAHQFIPESVDDYYMWKEMMFKHRLYRQDLVRRGLNTSESSIKPRPVEQPTATINRKPTPTTITETVTAPISATVPVSEEKKPSMDLLLRAMEECSTLQHQTADLLAEVNKTNKNSRLLFSEIHGVWSEMKASGAIKGTTLSADAKGEIEKSLPLVSALDGTDDSDDDSDDEDVSTRTAKVPLNELKSLDAAVEKKKGKTALTPTNFEANGASPATTPTMAHVLTPAATPVSTPAATPSQKVDEEKTALKPIVKKKDTKKSAGSVSQAVPPPPPPAPPVVEKKVDEDKPPSVSLVLPLPLPPPPPVVQKPPPPPKIKEAPPPPPPPPVPPAPVVVAQPAPPPPPPPPVHRQRREVLPSVQIPGEALGLSALAAAAMRGLPITTFEPLGLLQVICEELRYLSQTVGRAVSSSDAIDRMCYVAAFAVSGYSGMVGRNRKPFNPMLGETFDYFSEDGWKYHGEQVGHHPPTSAVIATGKGFEWWQTVQGVHKTTWGGNIELMPEYPVRLRVNGEEYIWNKVKTTILNAAAAPEQRILRNEGVMMIRCSSGVECKLVFKGDKNSVTGEIKDKRNGATCKLIGRWDKGLNRQLPGEDQESVFEVPPLYPQGRNYYGFSKFSMGLNELFPEDKDKLPYTDSRFRPDMRFVEYADATRALAAKHQLEGDQRQRAKSGRAAKPIWFEYRVDEWSAKKMWLTNDRYWRSRQQKFQDEYSQSACHVFGSQEMRQ